jgi:outer membrane protein assembly factor BamB
MKNTMRWTGMVAACVLLLEVPTRAQDWPQWRGPNRDNKITGFTVPPAWPKELSKQWQVNVGVGESSPVLVGTKLYVHARQGGDEVIQCLDAASGKEIWKDKYATQPAAGPASKHPGPRSTPAVAEGKICTFGVRGVLSCLDAVTGKLQWREDTKAWPSYFTSASPLITEGLCIIYQGTDKSGMLAAHDLTTGKQKWQWNAQGAPYGSPVLLTADGTKQVVTLTSKAIVGVSLDGKLLWQVPFAKGYNDTTGTPIVDGQNIICFGQDAGAIALRIEKDRDGVTAKQVWKKAQTTHRYNTPVLRDGLLYGMTPGKLFFCMNAQTGETLWTDKTKRGECGTILNAGSVLLALTSDSALLAIQPSDKGYRELAKYTVADAPTWAYPIIAGKRVYVKDKAGSLTLWTFDVPAGG